MLDVKGGLIQLKANNVDRCQNGKQRKMLSALKFAGSQNVTDFPKWLKESNYSFPLVLIFYSENCKNSKTMLDICYKF